MFVISVGNGCDFHFVSRNEISFGTFLGFGFFGASLSEGPFLSFPFRCFCGKVEGYLISLAIF